MAVDVAVVFDIALSVIVGAAVLSSTTLCCMNTCCDCNIDVDINRANMNALNDWDVHNLLDSFMSE